MEATFNLRRAAFSVLLATLGTAAWGSDRFSKLPEPAPSQNFNIAQQLTIDVHAVEILGSFSLNGGSFPDTFLASGRLTLLDEQEHEVLLGNSPDQAYGPLMVVAGTYTPAYTKLSGSDTVPYNPLTPLGLPRDVQAHQRVNVDVPSVTLRPRFFLNGQPFPADANESARILLRDKTTRREFAIGETHLPFTSIAVLPGLYDVIYELREGSGGLVPVNRHAIVMTDVDITRGGELNIDIGAVDLLSIFSLNGGNFPDSVSDNGEFHLQNASGDSALLGNSRVSQISTRVIPGTYDIMFRSIESNSLVPVNPNARVLSAVSIEQDLALNVDVPTVIVLPQPTLNGSAFPDSVSAVGDIVLQGADPDDAFVLVTTREQNPAGITIVPGMYDIYYQAIETSAIVPVNTNALIDSGADLTSSQTLPIDVPAIEIAASFTVNGQPFLDSVSQVAEFHLRGTSPGDEFLLGTSREQGATVIVVPGTYDVLYRNLEGNRFVPGNTEAEILTGVSVAQSTPLHLDVAMSEIQPHFFMNGAAFPDTGHAVFSLRDPVTGAETPLGSNGPGQAIQVIPGVYDVLYRFSAGMGIPRNATAVVEQILVD